MRYKRWPLVNKLTDEVAKNGRGVVYSSVGGLTEEQKLRFLGGRPLSVGLAEPTPHIGHYSYAL